MSCCRSGFLDGFLCLAERYRLRLAAPAHRIRSHAAWRLTRRRWRSVVRETAFVEIGPVTALHRETFAALLPFPAVGMGWGLDAHWSWLARERGWRIGVVDLLPGRPPRRAAGVRLRARGGGRGRRARSSPTTPTCRSRESQRTLAVHRRCA